MRKYHAPFWSSGRRSDPPIDCNILTLVRAMIDAALSCLRVWHIPPVRHTVTCHGRWPASLVTSGLQPCMESHLRFC